MISKHNVEDMSDDDIGGYLKKQRRRRKLTQQQVAEANSWDQTKVSKLETGTMLPSIDDMEALARLFEVPLVRLVKLRARAA
jgi:transcriptional regulator with XRE-family HTH domain